MLKCSKIGYNIKELMKINIYIWFNTQLFMNINRFVPCQITICIVMLIMLTSPYLCRKMMKKTGGSKLMTSTVHLVRCTSTSKVCTSINRCTDSKITYHLYIDSKNLCKDV